MFRNITLVKFNFFQEKTSCITRVLLQQSKCVPGRVNPSESDWQTLRQDDMVMEKIAKIYSFMMRQLGGGFSHILSVCFAAPI